MFQSYLSYTEGCYSGVRTLDAKNLWTDLDTQAKVIYVTFLQKLIVLYEGNMVFTPPHKVKCKKVEQSTGLELSKIDS